MVNDDVSALGLFERAPAMYRMSHWMEPSFFLMPCKNVLAAFQAHFVISQTYRGSVASQKLYIVVVFVPSERHVASNLYNLLAFSFTTGASGF
jgi:hypothetical protein